MKRLLISTTALSIALSGINPAMLMAQQGKAPVVCAEGTGADCEPKGQKKAKNREERQKEAAGEQGQKQGQKKAAKPDQEARQPKQNKQEQNQNQAQQDQGKKQRPEAEAAKPAPTARQQTTQAPEPEPRPRDAARDAQRAADDAPVVPPKATAGNGNGNGGNGNDQSRAERRAERQAAEQEATGGQGRSQLLLEPSKGVKQPEPEAVDALADILATSNSDETPAERAQREATEPGTQAAPRGYVQTRRPAAAERDLTAAPEPGENVTRRRITRDDVRRSDQDFATRAGSEDRNARRIAAEAAEKAKKKDGGLSDLEKAGLVVLGALAVGALLNNGDRVVSNTGDRVVVDQGDGRYVVLKDDDTLLRQPGTDVQTETFVDGSTRTTVLREDGSRVVTIRDASGRTLRRALVWPDGTQQLLIDDLDDRVQPVDLANLPRPQPGGLVVSTSDRDAELRAAMLRMQSQEAGRSFSLQQIRDYPQVRALAPTIDVESITFETGSAAIRASEAQKLAELGRFMQQMIAENRGEMFLIEGHTDAVGSAVSNLALSDRRAESVALALTEYFDVPPENMVVQGYGEAELEVATETADPRNRRAVVRMISPLMTQLADAR